MTEFDKRDGEDRNRLFDFVFLSAKFDVLCSLLHSGQLKDERIPECIAGITDASEEIRSILSKDREEFSVVSCDLDVIWQAFQEMSVPPTDRDVQVVRDGMVCVRDTIYFTDDDSIVSLGFKFELARLHFVKEYLGILSE
jgi:hypothetical protein